MNPIRIFQLVNILFIILALHLFKMQVLDHGEYREKSEENRIRPVILDAPRGTIVDRFGRELAGNRLSYDVYIVPREGEGQLQETFQRISTLIRVSGDELQRRYKARKRGPFNPVLLADHLGQEEAIRTEETSDELPGVFVKTRPVRSYVLGEATAHALGFVGVLNPSEYDALKTHGYCMTDTVGKDGIEKVYDGYLRGKNGAVKYEADSRGRLVRVLSIQEPHEGRKLQVTLDMDLQRILYDELKGQTGSAIVMELQSGGILAYVNAPAYDPNVFSGSVPDRSSVMEVLNDPKKPFINRGISGEYPPGSTFKMVTGFKALQMEKITKDTQFFCPGSYRLGRHVFRCWHHGGHGAQNLIQALTHSCNVFFYNLGMKLDADELARGSREFGLGRKTLIDLPGEKDGLVPDREWKRKNLKEQWYRGESLNYAIGQGFLLVTPLQIMRAAAMVASDGYLFKPHVVRQIDEVDITPTKPRRVFDDEAMGLIREGMEQVVQGRTGTGLRARSEKVRVSGKTGTAQSSSGKDHAWFVGYAPSGTPEAAVVVFLEHGGKGGMTAATIAGKTFGWMSENGYFRT